MRDRSPDGRAGSCRFWAAPGQKSGTTSPPLRVPIAANVDGATLNEIIRTDPSQNTALIPLGWDDPNRKLPMPTVGSGYGGSDVIRMLSWSQPQVYPSLTSLWNVPSST